MQPDPTPDLDEIEKRHEYATSALEAVCKRDWKMRVSVPAKPNHDDDLVISASLQDIPALLRAARERDELRAIMSGDMDDFVVKAQEEAMAKLRARAEKAEAKIGEIAWRAAEVATKLQEAEARAKELEGLYTRQCALTELKEDRAARAKGLPSPEAVEAAKDALREAEDYMRAEGAFSFAERLRAAHAKLEGR